MQQLSEINGCYNGCEEIHWKQTIDGNTRERSKFPQMKQHNSNGHDLTLHVKIIEVPAIQTSIMLNVENIALKKWCQIVNEYIFQLMLKQRL